MDTKTSRYQKGMGSKVKRFSVAFSPLEFGFGLAIGVLVDLLGRKLVESKKRRLLQLNVQ